MATIPTQIRIDSNIKREATALFSNLGLDMSSEILTSRGKSVTIFLYNMNQFLIVLFI